jgi:hypothetical protein
VPAGTYTLTIAGLNEDAAATGDLDITSAVVIQGAGANVTTVSGGGLDRVFDVITGGDLTLRGLRITNGNPGANGGGIMSRGTLLVDRCAIVGNTGSLGGGIFTAGTASDAIIDTEVSGNVATNQGGGLDLQGSGGRVVTNVTVSGNSAGGSIAGVVLINGGTITNVTIALNTDPGGALGHSLVIAGSAATLRNTLVVTAQGGLNCSTLAALVDGGGNFAAGGTCGVVPATAAVAANLAALAVTAPGTTATQALLAGNPAIGGAIAANCPSADQRGVTRSGVACDSGAYQFTVAATPTPTPTPTPAPPGTGPSPTISGITNQMLEQSTPLSIPFTISGAVIPNALRASATTSNPTLFPTLASSITCDLSGRCVLELMPADGRAGSGLITITVSDGTLTTSQSFTATVSVVRPSVPTFVAATSVGSGVTLTWAPPDTGVPLAYVLTWGTTAGASNLPVQLIAGDATRFDVLALPSGTYFLRLAAVGTGDVGPAAPERQVVVTTAAIVPGPPMGIEAAAIGADMLEATWHVPTFGAPVTLYELQIGTALGLADVASPTNGGLYHDQRVGAGVYWVRVRAASGGAVGPWSSSVQVPIGAAACTSAPAPPVLLPVTVTPGAAGFTWIPRGTAADRYQVQVAPGAGLAPTISLTSASAGASLTWLTPQGTWAGRVVARNACGTSAPSNEIRFVQP